MDGRIVDAVVVGAGAAGLAAAVRLKEKRRRVIVLEAQAELARPVADRLFFAGEATHTGGFAGTVHGALETGTRAADEVIAADREA